MGSETQAEGIADFHGFDIHFFSEGPKAAQSGKQINQIVDELNEIGVRIADVGFQSFGFWSDIVGLIGIGIPAEGVVHFSEVSVFSPAF